MTRQSALLCSSEGDIYALFKHEAKPCALLLHSSWRRQLRHRSDSHTPSLLTIPCASTRSTSYKIHRNRGPATAYISGRGLVITAAHVVGSASRTKPSVRIAGLDLPATAIREGSFERVDLTLLSIDEQKLPISLQMRRMPLCEKPPWVGEPVIVAVPEGTARSRIMSPLFLQPAYRIKFGTVIADVATTGNSGSGVFDAGNKCLLGIMSRKFQVTPTSAGAGTEPKDIAKYFVPASTIRAFIPAEYRF